VIEVSRSNGRVAPVPQREPALPREPAEPGERRPGEQGEADGDDEGRDAEPDDALNDPEPQRGSLIQRHSLDCGVVSP
jgi:hypothetical protein